RATGAAYRHVVDFLAPLDRLRVFSLPRIRGDFDRRPVLVGTLPTRREGLHIRKDRLALDVRNVPGEHRGAVQPAADGALQRLVGRSLPRLHAGELEQAAGEVSRRRAHRGRRGAVTVSLFAVATVAIEHVRVVPIVERLGIDRLAVCELVRLVKLLLRTADGRNRNPCPPCPRPHRGHACLLRSETSSPASGPKPRPRSASTSSTTAGAEGAKPSTIRRWLGPTAKKVPQGRPGRAARGSR